jgi:hypothetical protein
VDVKLIHVGASHICVRISLMLVWCFRLLYISYFCVVFKYKGGAAKSLLVMGGCWFVMFSGILGCLDFGVLHNLEPSSFFLKRSKPSSLLPWPALALAQQAHAGALPLPGSLTTRPCSFPWLNSGPLPSTSSPSSRRVQAGHHLTLFSPNPRIFGIFFVWRACRATPL